MKAFLSNKDRPILVVLNRVCLLDDPTEHESLPTTFNFWAHGVKCCMRPPKYGGLCGPFQWDKEKVDFNIEQPSDDNFLNLEWFELTSPHPELADRVRRKACWTTVSMLGCFPAQDRSK
jgi:hypothetical protein